MQNPFIISALMCHAPIVIPKIAGDRLDDCKKSTQSMKIAAKMVIEKAPNRIIIISPHTPRLHDSFGIITEDTIWGDFSQFGYPEISFNEKNDNDLLNNVLKDDVYNISNLKVSPITGTLPLDHGVMVPLYFLKKEGYKNNILIVSLPMYTDHEICQKMGLLLKKATLPLTGKTAIIASGDMSHRLIEGAPAGYDPKAVDFDEYVSQNISDKKYKEALEVDNNLRETAAEDVIDSLEISLSATDFTSEGSRFLSYEGPFGVGYLISILHSI